MMAQPQHIAQKSTIVRSETGAIQDGFGRRGGHRQIQRIWSGDLRRPDGARGDQPAGRQAATGADRLERWVTGVLTLIAAGYGIAVLARIVVMYG